MAKHKIALTTAGKTDTSVIERELDGLDYEMSVHVCTSPGETMEAVKGRTSSSPTAPHFLAR